jgi:hypothetical protein
MSDSKHLIFRIHSLFLQALSTITMPLTEISNNASRLGSTSSLRSHQLKENGNVGKIHSKVRGLAQAEPSRAKVTVPLTPISNNVAAFAPISKANNSQPKPIEVVRETPSVSVTKTSEVKISMKESTCNHRKNQTLPTRASKIENGSKHEDSETLMDWGCFLSQPLEGPLVYKNVPFLEQLEENQTKCHLCESTFHSSKQLDEHCQGKHHQVAYQLLEAFHSFKHGNDENLKARLNDSLFLCSRISALPKDRRTEMNKVLCGHLQNTQYKKWSVVMKRLEHFEMVSKVCIATRTSTETELPISKKDVAKNEAKQVLATAATTAPPTDKENQEADSTVMRPSNNVFCAGKQAAGAIVGDKTITKDISKRVNENVISLEENSAVSLLCVRISALPKNHQIEMNEALWGHLQNTHYKKWSAVMTRLEHFEKESKIYIATKSSPAKKVLANTTTAPRTDKENQTADSNYSTMSKTEIPKTVMHPSNNVFYAGKPAVGAIVSNQTIIADTSKRVNEKFISVDENSLSEDDLQFSPSSQEDQIFCSSFSSLIAVQQHFQSHDDDDEVDSMIQETLLGISILEIDEFSFEDDDYDQHEHDFPEEVEDWADEHNLDLCYNESLNTIPEVNESMFSCAEPLSIAVDKSFTQLIEIEEPEDEETASAAPNEDVNAALAVIEALAFFGL